MIRACFLSLILCLPLALASCGDLPEPFLGNPGATARRLARPPTALLAVPPADQAMLPDPARRNLAKSLASALQAQELPALAQTASKADWVLVTKAQRQGDIIVPQFNVLDPQGKQEGSVQGAPVTLSAWTAGDPATLQAVAADAAPKIAAMQTGIRIAQEKADPNSLYNRPAKVMVPDVTGAPGDGDEALTRQMRMRLAAFGPVVLTEPAGMDFKVQGQVRAVPIPGGKQRIEIQWIITDADGKERGRVVQLNEIPAGTLSRYWGDVAVVVASEAAGGINDVLDRQTGHKPQTAATSSAATSPDAATPAAASPAAASPAGMPPPGGMPEASR